MEDLMLSRESVSLEYKEQVSPSYLKTVSAFANFGTGRVVFGVDDGRRVVGLDDPVGDALRIENAINDSIDPRPTFSLQVDEAARTVTLLVQEGAHKPYLCKGRAYRRSDASTVEVNKLEYGRLVLEGSNLYFDQLESSQENLSFDLLGEKLADAVGIATLGSDVLRTLGLQDRRGRYTKAAEILADSNAMAGTDMVRFGDSINDMLDRATVVGASALRQYDSALEMYERYYVFERVEGGLRRRHELVPYEAFRETIANALVHRTWDVPANITVGMHPDRIEVVSPGSLPTGLTEEDYLSGFVSLLRNPTLAGVFFRLDIVEKFGTGIMRIRDAYEGAPTAPAFSVRAGSVAVTLPVVSGVDLSDAEERVWSAVSKGRRLTRAEISERVGFSKDKTIRLLNALVARGLVERVGEGPGTRYRRP